MRELENVIQRATVVAQGTFIAPEHVAPPPIVPGSPQVGSQATFPYALHDILARVEKETIQKALETADWNRTKTAELLKIDRRVLFSKIKEYGLKKLS